MKRTLLYIFTFITIILALTQPAVVNALSALLFLGIVPGTDTTIPFGTMIIGFIVSSILIISWLFSQPLYIGSIASQQQTARHIARKSIVSQAHSTRQTTRAKRHFTSSKTIS